MYNDVAVACSDTNPLNVISICIYIVLLKYRVQYACI